MNQNFLWICKSTHYVLDSYKVSRNSVEWFQRSCADKKNRTDRLTDGRVKNIIHSATRWVGYENNREKEMESKFPVDMRIYTLCPSYLQSFTKFCWVVSEELRWQEKQDWLTDRLTDGSKTLYPPQLVAWGIITFWSHEYWLDEFCLFNLIMKNPLLNRRRPNNPKI